jgi:protein SCO1/2
MSATSSAEPARAPFDAATTEDEIAAWVDTVAATGGGAALVPLLEERHPLYRGRGANQTLRIRGWTMAAFERAGLPDAALPAVLSELESGREPYLVAAAARALRGLPRPQPRVAPFLRAALDNLRFHDDAVSFDRYKPSWPAASRRTAAEEVRETLARFEAEPGAAGSACCALPAAWRGVRRLDGAGRPPASLGAVELEDQDGCRLGYPSFFARDEPAVAVFFYTRCANPGRCSLTVTRLAGLRRALAAAGLAGCVRTAAISYDAGHDLPGRLRTYGADRGLAADERNRLFRVVAGGRQLDEHFQLGVNYLGSIVNRHRVELFVLDGEGRIAASFTGLRWRDDEVVETVRGLSEPGRTDRGAVPRGLLATAAAAAAALLPKCPLCWAAYTGALGVAGAGWLRPSPWLTAAVAAALLVHLAALFRGAARRNGRSPFWISLAGATLVLPSAVLGLRWPGLAGLGAIAAGAALGSLPPGALAAGAVWVASLFRRRPGLTAPVP